MARGPPCPLYKPNIKLRVNLVRSEPPEMAVFLYPKTKRKTEVIRLWDFLRVQLAPCKPLL